MKLIGENLHIISKKTKTAIENRDKDYVLDIAKREIANNVDWIDLNIGPARRGWEGVMPWLSSSVLELGDVKFSFDTTNAKEMEAGLMNVNNASECIINSTSADPNRLETMMGLASKYNSNIIALTMSDETGIPKDADGRLEIACVITEKAEELGICNSKIFLDPLVLPVSVDQSQVMEALNSIRVFKESFDPPVKTTIGLSNVSNGSPREMRPLLNRVFAVMAMGCGLDSAIVDMFDADLLRIIKVVANNAPEKDSDKLMIQLFELMQNFGEFEDLTYNKDNKEEVDIYKTVRIFFDKNIYAHNYLDEQ